MIPLRLEKLDLDIASAVTLLQPKGDSEKIDSNGNKSKQRVVKIKDIKVCEQGYITNGEKGGQERQHERKNKKTEIKEYI